MSGPVGAPVATHPAARPDRVVLEGRYGRLRPLDPARDAAALFPHLKSPDGDAVWTYLAAGPFADYEPFAALVAANAASNDPFYFAVADREDRALGWLSLMRIDPPNRVIEVGWITYAPALQRTPLATEAQFLAMAFAFETLGNRRYEWKCNDLNAPSKRAAERFGFQWEGLFRQAAISKGRNRDTAWYSILDTEWPQVKLAFERWLDPANFDASGRQKVALGALTRRRETVGAISFRRATMADVPAIAALKERAYLPNEAITQATSLPRMVDYSESIRREEVWVAEEAGALIAAALFLPGADFVVVSIAADPTAQGQGLGRAMLMLAERRAREQGSAAMVLYTNARLERRIAWYERNGFRRTRQDVRPDRVVQHLRKDLT